MTTMDILDTNVFDGEEEILCSDKDGKDCSKLVFFHHDSFSVRGDQMSVFASNLTSREQDQRCLDDMTAEGLKKVQASSFHLVNNWFFPLSILIAVTRNLSDFLMQRDQNQTAGKSSPGLPLMLFDVVSFLRLQQPKMHDRINRAKTLLLKRAHEILEHGGKEVVDKLSALEVNVRLSNQSMMPHSSRGRRGEPRQGQRVQIHSDQVLNFSLTKFMKEGGVVMPELSGLNVMVRLYHRSTDWSPRSAHSFKTMNTLESERIDTSSGISLVRQNWPYEAEYAIFMAILKHPKTQKIVALLHEKGLDLDVLEDWAHAPWAKNITELKRAVAGLRGQTSTADKKEEKKEEKKIRGGGAGPSTPPPLQDTQDLLEGEGDEEYESEEVEEQPVLTKKRKAALALGIAANYGKKQKK